jgi:tetratricopeptide (TPR) repeat protein
MRPPASNRNARPNPQALRDIDSLLQQKRYREALVAVTPLAEQFPCHPEVLMQHGCALAWTSDFSQAEPLLLQALEHYPKRVSLLTLLSRCYFETQRYEDAERVLAVALQKIPGHLDALYMLGRVKAERGDHPAAEAAFRRALAQYPTSGSLNYSVALYHHYTAADAIFTQLPAALEQPSHSYFERVLGHFALGKAYLDIEQHETAFQWFYQGNQLAIEEGKVLDSYPSARHQLVHLMRGITKASFEKANLSAAVAYPHIVIIGASRSGKSLVETQLTTGTNVSALGESTVLADYMSEVLTPYGGDIVNYINAVTPEICRQHAESYLALREGEPLSTLTLPEHVNFLGVLALWFPTMPLVFCRRDLHDVAISQYFSYYGKGNAHSYDLPHLGEYLAYYERLMRHWEKVLPNPIVPVSYEALTHTPEASAAALFRALEMPLPVASHREENALVPSHPVRSLDVPMPLSQAFNGIAEPFKHHLIPMEAAYKKLMQMPIVSSLRVHAPTFRWQVEGSITVMEQGGMLLPTIYTLDEAIRQPLTVIAFDPANVAQRLVDEKGTNGLHYFPNAALGSGVPQPFYHCLAPSQSSLLEPKEKSLAVGPVPKVLARIELPTIALDRIEGIDNVEALALGIQHDVETVLAHGRQRLKGLLILQVRLCMQPRYEKQPDMASMTTIAASLGLRFYRLLNPIHQTATASKALTQQTQLETVDVLFVPDDEKLKQLTAAQRMKLAFLLDNVWGLYDPTHAVLSMTDTAQAQRYAQARGARAETSKKSLSAVPVTSPTPLDEARKALAEHSIHRAIEITGKLIKHQPQDPHVLGLHGYCVMRLGHVEKSLPWLRRACELDQHIFETHRWLFESLLRNGKRQEARRLLKQMKQQVTDVPEQWAESAAIQLLLEKETASKTVVKEALQKCESALAVRPEHPQLLHLAAKANARLSRHEKAVALYTQAITALNERNPPLKTEWLIERSSTHETIKEIDNACNDVAEAFSLRPYSVHTKKAYQHFVQLLPQSQAQTLRQLAPLHSTIHNIWQGYKDEALTHVFGDYDLPYQAFEPLLLPGSRPSMARLRTYQLERYLPENARALDIGCNHGFLLLGLAPQLAYGYGFDISQACVDVGRAVADHLGIHHVELKRQEFEGFVCDEPFDLVIACAVHRWIGMPIEAFGEQLHRFCRRGGIVLLESQGIRSTQHTEPDFAAKAERIASAGFAVVDKGSLCDDKLNYREYWILQRA